jgi:hypothetical protein
LFLWSAFGSSDVVQKVRQGVQVGRSPVSEEMTPRTPFLQDLERVRVRESAAR